MQRITKDIARIISALSQSDIAAIPTETVYGLAADATDKKAVLNVFATKKRPTNHPLIMHVAKDEDITQWVGPISSKIKYIMGEFWPGPLTLVFNLIKKNNIANVISGSQNTIAIRQPNHKLAQELLQKYGNPLVAPSANLFTKISPTTAYHVLNDFPNENFLILDGGRCINGIESTIVDVRDPKNINILRSGALDLDINKIIKPQYQHEIADINAPGTHKIHYQPRKKLFYFEDDSELRDYLPRNNVFLFNFDDKLKNITNNWYQLSSNPEKVAYDLYYQLRLADEMPKIAAILVELPPKTNEWTAIREKLYKAGLPLGKNFE